jgi:anti-anti-sigma factor
MNHPQLDSEVQFVSGVRELVRGQERAFSDALYPLVRVQSICLDMAGVERIDAAGLAALISLRRDAWKAGHEVTVVNPSHQVARMLAVVGLERMVVPGETAPA